MQDFNSQIKSNILGRCYRLSIDVIKMTDALPKKPSAWIIADQLIRAATSIGANITEGKAASSRLEFKKFYQIALKSANDSLYWLNLLSDVELVEKDIALTLIKENTELCSMLAAGVIKLKSKL